MAQKKKAEYAKPASQVALEEAQENGFRSNRVLDTAPEFEAPEDDENARDLTGGAKVDNYAGVDLDYQNYANKTEAPLRGKGPEDKLADSVEKGATEVPDTEDDDQENESEEPEEDEDEVQQVQTGVPASAQTKTADSSKSK